MNNSKEDMKKAQKEFDETVATCVVFLNKNGVKIEFIREMLHRSLDEVINDYVEKRDD